MIRALVLVGVLTGVAHADDAAVKIETQRTAGTALVVPDRPELAKAKPGDRFSADLEFCVDTDGMVSAARVRDDSAYGKTVVQWTRAWRFKPVLEKGKPVSACGMETIRYEVPANPAEVAT